MDFDLVIANGTVLDGSGQPRYRADLGIRGGRIAALSRAGPLRGREILDAAGLAVAPGFIDIHSHSDWVLPLPDHDQIMAPLLLQGITTMVAGNCGCSPAPVTDRSLALVNRDAGALLEREFPYRWRSTAEFLDVLEGGGLLLNVALLVGHGSLRRAVMGDRPDAPAPDEARALGALVRQALRDGAFGLSAGLGYSPGAFAGGDELLPLVRAVAEEGGVYAVDNGRYRCATASDPAIPATPANVLAVREQLELARRSGARLQLSHLIFVGRSTWPTHRQVLEDIESAASEGLDVAFDAYPYTFGNTTINVNFPKWFLSDLDKNLNDPGALQRLEQALETQYRLIGRGYRDMSLVEGGAPELAPLEGLDFTAIARRLGLPEFEAYLHIARRTRGRARIMQDTFSGDADTEEPLRQVLRHPLCAFMLDVILTRTGRSHPASLGAFPRILGRYSRDLALFPLEDAVRRMTSFPAGRVGLRELGRIQEGFWADLVVFNPETIADHATRQRPEAPPTGIEAVLISGQTVVRQGQVVSRKRRGRLLRRRA